MIEELTRNAQRESEIVREMSKFSMLAATERGPEKKIFEDMILSLKAQLKIVNASVGELTRKVSLAKKIPGPDVPTGLVRLADIGSSKSVAIKAKDKQEYLKQLQISEVLLKRLRKNKTRRQEVVIDDYKKPSSYTRLANRIFLPVSKRLLGTSVFKDLAQDLRRSNLNILGAAYISVMLLTTLLAFILGIGFTIFFAVFSLSTTFPFISLSTGNIILSFFTKAWIALAPPVISVIGFYFYPYLEKKSLGSKIDSELPFVVIHMGSISGSGVEPTQIFKIVGLSKDYPATRTEIRKLLNQINVYGYDLLTALRNVASNSPSTKLAELFNGLATTISSGGDLKTFFEKRAEVLLLQYRLEREKFTKVAETFMDIYISVVIATPMILLLLLVMISVTDINVGGLTVPQLTLVIIIAVALINVVFLWLLSLKQPNY